MESVSTRIGISPFAPNQHIGVYRSFLVNVFVSSFFGGNTYLRIDDTNPRHTANIDQLIDDLTNVIDNQYFTSPPKELCGISLVGSKGIKAIFESKRIQIYLNALEKIREKGYIINNDDAIYFNTPKFIKEHGDILNVPYNRKNVRTAQISTTLPNGPFPLVVEQSSRALWHLTSVVDDITLGVTHIIRAHDKIDNQVPQAMLYAILGETTPQYFYTKTLVGSPPTINELTQEGICAEAIRSYLYGTITGKPEKLYFSFNEALEDFSPQSIVPGQIQYDHKKILAIQRQIS